MADYKKILSGYVNLRDDSSEYLVITNVSDEDVTIKAGEKLFLNKTPSDILAKHPKVPHFSKSFKLDDAAKESKVKYSSEKVADQIPF